MHHNPYQTLGIGVAFSPNLQANLSEATRLAKMLETRLILIHVGEQNHDKEKQIKELLPADSNDYQLVFKPGNPVESIVAAVDEYDIDLLILGAVKEEKFVRYYLGSIARKITRKASCSVLLLTNPSVERFACAHIVVNGLEDEHTAQTIQTAFHVAHKLKTPRITIVEEINKERVNIKIDDDQSLQRANELKDKLRREEDERVQKILETIPQANREGIKVATQPIFGTRGYSIGHYAQIKRADLLVMNAPKRSKAIDRMFPHDMEYILNELPTDVLIVR
ncbi:universal stress protein [Nonlabens ponticola]|uniref:Universal stress protein n=1 Tax=Nonlabens ponticola TaxID=2496866 RepID=A0A3S9MVJ8_9FLAO|nr:universal stress protein [Nonlabens ponticola]AZQ43172.1 universal stress protein [Nonlabens ponticola]